MSIKEKVAYLKGFAEGLGLDPDVKADKLISVIIDTLADIADEIEELNENDLDIGEELDAISDDLAEVEEFLFGDDYDDDDDYDDFDFGDDDDDDDDSCDYCGSASFSYEVECPACGEEIVLDESDLELDSVNCPSCGEELEFDFSDGDDEDDDDEDDEDDEDIDEDDDDEDDDEDADEDDIDGEKL